MLGAGYSPFASRGAVAGEVVVYGSRWCGVTMMVRRHLDRAGVPYRFVDWDAAPQARTQLEWLAGGPSPGEAMALIEEVQALMHLLEPSQRRILELRLQGFNLDEIAATVGCTQRTVRRALDRIKHLAQESATRTSR